ncbi:MAG TPA: helix-turn-helix domain-containing protein [Pyrinomonadaceae bacterium]|nr:helix-turn-helix domain-containing protein [Pyrinomonadaceae bacterium]
MSEAANSGSGSSLATRHAPPDVYDDGHLRVEHDNYYVSCGGDPLRFRRAEFLLLSRLARNAERVVRADELWRHAWGDGKPYNAESLHVHVYRLRSKLAPFGVQIETMVNVGYRLVPAAGVSERRPA